MVRMERFRCLSIFMMLEWLSGISSAGIISQVRKGKHTAVIVLREATHSIWSAVWF